MSKQLINDPTTINRVRIRTGVVIIDRGSDIYVGHLQRHLIFSERGLLPMLRQLREWSAIDFLLATELEQPEKILEVIARLDDVGLIERSPESALNRELVISQMNEVGALLAPILLDYGFEVSTLDLRSATTSDIRGAYLRMSDIGEPMSEVLLAQRRELINSGHRLNKKYYESSSNQSEKLSRKLVILTSYPEPELIASLMAEGCEYFAVLATPFGALLGPYVKPGITPCFYCVELGRSDLDPQWQKIAATLFMERNQPVARTSALLAVATLAEQLIPILESEISHDRLAYTDSLRFDRELKSGREPSIRSSRQVWSAHPACSCHWGR